MNLKQLTKDIFNNAVEAVSHIVHTEKQQLDTRQGSVIRELVIRPFAFCYAYVIQTINNWLSTISIKNLSQSQATDTQIVDIIAGNFFLQRNESTYASGYVTITTKANTYSIFKNTKFNIDGHIFRTQKTYVISNGQHTDTEEVSFLYSKAISGNTSMSNNTYISNIPVVSQQPGYIQIPEGVEVTCSVNILDLVDIELLSPITGGKGAQTDASLLQRCKYSIRNSIGTLASIKQCFMQNNVPVLSCNALDSSSMNCYRSRLNNTVTAGVADLYVKIQNQASIKTVEATVTTVGVTQLNTIGITETDTGKTWYKAIIQGPEGWNDIVLRVLNVQVDSKTLQFITVFNYEGYQEELASNDFNIKQNAYRLSEKQRTVVYFKSAEACDAISIKVSYIPNIKEIDTFINSEQHKFLGLDLLTKAALPVTTYINAHIKSQTLLSDQQLYTLKVFISDIINSMQVGQNVLNMDDVAQRLQLAYPTIQLRLPYYMSYNMPTFSGQQYGTTSNTGVIDLKATLNQAQRWKASLCYFSTTPNYINLQVV